MTKSNNVPRVVNWTGYLSLAMLLILPVSVLAARTGAWQPGLLLYAIAILGSTLLMLILIILLLVPGLKPWRNNISLNLLFAFPGTLLLLTTLSGGNVPTIHDITTDVADPPIFAVAAQMRGEDANTLDIKPAFIAEQTKAYPDLQPLQTDLPRAAAFDRALRVARQMGWEVYHEDPEAGVIEAVDITRFMAFKDDIVIRVRQSGQGAVIDLRSVSRVGLGDLGANAKRIRAFVEAFDQQD
ncbi:MAG: DUF1499 domain-containing protein [Halioglobus sp.]|nr:DUF1499 domain-containing protein [Halioglobus sp.]